MEENGKSNEEVCFPRQGYPNSPFDDIRNAGEEKTEKYGKNYAWVKNDYPVHTFEEDEPRSAAAIYTPRERDAISGVLDSGRIRVTLRSVRVPPAPKPLSRFLSGYR